MHLISDSRISAIILTEEDDDVDGTVEAVSAADSIDNNIFVSKEAKLWQMI